VKALGTYSLFDGDSSRRIDLAPYGGTVAASIGGDPDVNMWTVGLHAGARIATSKTSVLTPYLNIDHVDAKLDQLVEQTTGGDEGAELTVLGGTSKHTFLTGGVKWAGKVGGLVPEVNLGYRYRLGDKRASFSACFDGDPDCAFDIVSAAEKRGSFLAGLNVGGKLGPVDVRVSYEGEFNSDVTSHSANLKLVVPLGGRKH
jgi:uncharacterized protein with beta-barrel porin domain